MVLLNAATAVTVGTWERVSSYTRSSVHVKGITTATVIINGSNSATKPANADHEIQLSSVTADELVSIDLPVKWMKVRVSAYTSGTISAWLEGVR